MDGVLVGVSKASPRGVLAAGRKAAKAVKTDPAAAGFAGAVAGGLTGRHGERRRQARNLQDGNGFSKRALGPTYRGTHGQYASSANKLLFVDNAGASDRTGKLVTVVRRADRRGGLQPLVERRARSTSSGGNAPTGNSRGQRLR